MTMVLFQLNFYTDVFGLSANAAAAILLWPRLWDAIFDPVMGVLADRTKTRWGSFPPWILWTSVPWVVVMIAGLTTPDPSWGWSTGMVIAYAGITNTLDDALLDEQHALLALGGDDGRPQRARPAELLPLRLGQRGAVHRRWLHAAAGLKVRTRR